MEELIRDYENLYSIRELINKYHIGQDKIRKILKENGVHIRSNSESRILRLNKGKTLQEIENKVIDNYVNKKYGQKRSGQEFGLSAAAVKRILKKYSIPIRDLHESICVANQTNDRTIQHYQKDISFF